MAKLTVGELMPDFTYETPFAKDLILSETVGRAKKTALLFLRYYGGHRPSVSTTSTSFRRAMGT